MLFAYSLRLFGMRIEVLQVVIDLLSLINVFAFYRLAVRLLPETLAFWASVTFIAIGATVTTYFSLFGLVAYTPAIHVAAIGLMLLLTEVVIYLDTGSCTASGCRLAQLFPGLCCQTGDPGGQRDCCRLTVLVSSRWLWFQGKNRFSAWLTHYVKLGLACFVPAALLYIQWGQIAGWTKFLACLSGFGLAKTACPWWPTGLVLLGAAQLTREERLFILPDEALALLLSKELALPSPASLDGCFVGGCDLHGGLSCMPSGACLPISWPDPVKWEKAALVSAKSCSAVARCGGR